jgi:phosphoadenosine phosphosulfate reductase
MGTALTAESIENLTPEEVLNAVLEAHPERPVCLTCSFQAEDMIALSLLRKRIPSIPVLFLDTGYHFAQTYEYRDQMVKEWSLNLVNVVPRETVERQES